jgi:hypothetical protein
MKAIASAMNPKDAAARRLMNAQAVRERSRQIFSLAVSGGLKHFTVDTGRFEAACDYVVRTIRANYPKMAVPPFARWRQFSVGEVDRWSKIAGNRAWADRIAHGRAAVDLAVVSVLLDAAPGRKWAFAEADTGETFGRGEGQAVACLTMFGRGVFSADPYDPLRADARRLSGLTAEELADGFQASRANPLAGLEERLAVLTRLGEVVAARTDVFGTPDGPRPGGLVDYFARVADGGRISAPHILEVLLDVLMPVWPGHFRLGSTPLGDTFAHPALRTGDATDGLVPLHRLAQWLVYSLIEPLVWSGFQVTDLDGLTALAEYRTGGLMVDMGVLKIRSHSATTEIFPVDHELVVEWRALTVASVDRLADGIRKRISRTADTFALPCIIEGGTWAAGRRIAREKRSDGAPPIRVANEGTYF